MIDIKQLKGKYRLIPKPAKATFWAIVCSIIQKCISFFATPIFTRILTTEQYGLCAVYDSWYMIFILFTSLSVFQNGFNNAMIKYEDRKEEFISAAQGLIFFITFCFGCIFLIFKSPICSLTKIPFSCMVVMLLELMFVPAYSLWMAKNRFEFEYVGVVIGTLVIAVLCPVLGVIAVTNSVYQAEAKIFAFGLVQVLAGVIFFVKNYLKGKILYDKEIWGYTLKLNVPLIPYYLSSIILAQADRIMINNMCGSTAAAIYSLAYTLSLIMTIVSNSINQSLIPYIYKKIREGEEARISSIVTLSCAVVAVMNCMLMFLGPELISFFGTEEYIAAKWVIPPVAASVYFIFIYSMFGVVQMYWGKTSLMVSASIAVAILNLLLNYMGIKLWGYLAAGYTTLISYIILVLVYYVKYRRIICQYMNSKQVFSIKNICLVTTFVLFSIVFSVILYELPDVYRYIAITVLIIICIANKKLFVRLIRTIRG